MSIKASALDPSCVSIRDDAPRSAQETGEMWFLNSVCTQVGETHTWPTHTFVALLRAHAHRFGSVTRMLLNSGLPAAGEL